MSRFTVTLDLPHPIARVWARLTDWESHSEWIPATTVTVLSGDGGLGTEFVGRTRAGLWVFDDPMTVTSFDPPNAGRAECEVTKTGQILKGTAGFTLTELGPQSTRLEWFEDVAPKAALVGYWLRPLIPVVGKAAFTAALDKFAATL